MPFTGTYDRTLDDKRRVGVPKQFREQFGKEELDSLFVAPGLDGSLVVYSKAGFDALASKFESVSSNHPKVRNYLRLFYSQAEQVEIDKQGRIRIPDRLTNFAQLRQNIVVLGVHDHLEIWAQEKWDEFLAENSRDFDELAAEAMQQRD